MFRFFRRATAPDPQPGSQLVESAPSNADAAAPTITESLGKTRGGFFGAVRNLFRTQVTLDEAFWESLEERLIAADLGAHVTADLVDELRARNGRRPFASGDEAEAALRELLEAILGFAGDPGLTLPVDGAAIILVIGVNGTGKTTTVAKLTKNLLDGGRKPHLIAGDTFRAAAIDQLAVWAERTGVPRGADTIIIDTAGRLHTKANLMAELEKVRRIIERRVPGAPHETLLVLDAVTGQNGLMQAKTFVGSVGVTGLVLTKLDSSAKGGVVFAIAEELKLPIKLIGTGERVEDVQPFDPQEFVRALFA
ncbi:MAG: signal recognition particle-docking protein FtsY [Proteobacteria bacterium]|nr:signal recognition particle-docking protein FtsY [Pseudomonadota bacterium]